MGGVGGTIHSIFFEKKGTQKPDDRQSRPSLSTKGTASWIKKKKGPHSGFGETGGRREVRERGCKRKRRRTQTI